MQVHQGRRPVVATSTDGIASDSHVRIVVVASRICNIRRNQSYLYPIRQPHRQRLPA